MDCECYEQPARRSAIYVPFTPAEAARFRAFLRSEGRKAGPWVRTLIVRALDAEERAGRGAGAADEAGDPAGATPGDGKKAREGKGVGG